MVKFGPLVFYLFGRPVFIYSAIWFGPIGPTLFQMDMQTEFGKNNTL